MTPCNFRSHPHRGRWVARLQAGIVLPGLALGVLLAAPAAEACNPDPARPPILEGHDYDRVAAEQLLRDATAVVAARFTRKIDVAIGGSPVLGSDPLRGDPARPFPYGGQARTDYVFEVLEGWRAEVPRRLVLGGYQVPCALPLERGRMFLLYLSGERLLHAVPVEQLDFEFALLGEPDWFFDAVGQRVRPVTE